MKRLILDVPTVFDSKKSKYKKRAWFLTHNKNENVCVMKCHNCDKFTNLGKLIKEHFQEFYMQYLQDKYLLKTRRTEYKPKEETKKQEASNTTSNILGYDLIVKHSEDIDSNLIAKSYIASRKIKNYSDFRFTSNVGKFINDINIKGYDNLKKINMSAIILPFFDFEGNLYAFQFRFLEKTKLRYMTIKLNKELDYKIWNLNKIDFDKDIYIAEGVFDAASLDNSIAMCGSSINFDVLEEFKENCIFIFDNEKDNEAILNKMRSVIDKGFRLFIWDNNIQEKDINKYLEINNNVDVFYKNNYKGLEAKFMLEKWLKKRSRIDVE